MSQVHDALATYGAKVEKQWITWEVPQTGLVVHIPLPPWSNAETFQQDCRIPSWSDPASDGQILTSWESDPPLNWEMPIYPSNDTSREPKWTYETRLTGRPLDQVLTDGTSKDPFISTSASRRIALGATETSSFGIDLHPAGSRPRIILLCARRLPGMTGLATLQFTLMQGGFDADDPDSWPVPKQRLIDWAHHMNGFAIRSASVG